MQFPTDESLAERIQAAVAPDLRTRLDQLTAALHEQGGRAFLVGGAVRDALRGETVTDFDIEVYGLEPAVIESVLKRFSRVDAVGKAFGVFKLHGWPMDVSLPRRESRTGPRHQDFKIEGDPHMTPEEAAQRRDFTINAISWDWRNRRLLDPCGGIEDLHKGRLRHISARFAEDPLRVLRGMQFVARFNLKPDPATVTLCRQLNPDHLPPERIFEEWRKLILQGQSIRAGLQFLEVTEWLQYYPELTALRGCEQDPHWHPEGDVWEHTLYCMDAFAANRIDDPWEDLVVGLGVLCHDMGKPLTSFRDPQGRIRSPRHDIEGVAVAEHFLQRMTRQKAIFEAVLPLVREHMRPHDLYSSKAGPAAIRKLSLRVGRMERLIRVSAADYGGRPPLPADDFKAGRWLAEQVAALELQRSTPKPIVQGRDLVELGLKPGPHFKAILDDCFEAQLNGVFDDHDNGRNYLNKLITEKPLDSNSSDSANRKS
jgi:tRNA nucleotidyltransferase (CCA-adding enzyme)